MSTINLQNERAAFERFMRDDHDFSDADLTFSPERNCYREYRIHLAWQAWRTRARLEPQACNATSGATMNTVLINIDGKDVAVAPGIDVLNIKAAAGIHGSYQLAQERLGLPDFQMDDSHVPELKGGEVFYSIPPTNGG